MKTRLLHIAKIIIVAEIVYVVVLNLALNLPWTQSLVNRIDPAKFQVHWSRAWTLYPSHLHAKDIDAWGETRKSLRWHVKSPEASALMSFVPLLGRTVKITNVDGRDIYYEHESAKYRAEEAAGLGANQPSPSPTTAVVEGTASSLAVEPLREQKASRWDVEVTGAYVSGNHEILINGLTARIEGTASADFTYRSAGKVVSLNHGKMELKIESLLDKQGQNVLRDAHVDGSLTLHPFSRKSVRGMDTLKYITTDALVQLETNRLSFLNIYLTNFNGMKADGTGFVQGRVHLDRGRLENGNELKVSARTLLLEVQGKQLKGEGTVVLKANIHDDRAEALVVFSSIEAFDTNSEARLFNGNGLQVEAWGSRSLVSDDEHSFIAERFAITIPEVAVSDLQAYQSFLPEKWLLKIHGGTGKLQGFITISKTGLESDLRLSSETADVGFDTYRFTSNLDIRLKLDSPAIGSGIDISDSHIRLEGTKLASETGKSAEPWLAEIKVEQGKVKLMLPDSIGQDDRFYDIFKMIKDYDIGRLIDSDGEEIRVVGSISDFSWLNVFIKNSYNLAISGAGDVIMKVFLHEGWIGTGSEIMFQPRTLGVDVLEYHAKGEGAVSLVVDKGGSHPDVNLRIDLEQAEMKRKGDSQALIEDVQVFLEAQARNLSREDKTSDMDLHLVIPPARIRDLSVFNQHLPAESPAVFNRGSADLTADISMTPDSAVGYVNLSTSDMSAHIDQQDVEGQLEVDISLVDGIPENMDFDISGSTVVLDNVRVAGVEAEHDDKNWSARLLLKKGRAVWKKPVALQVQADLEMSDSKPIVAIMANQRNKHGWLEKIVTIDKLHGEIQMGMADKRIAIPYAMATSDKIDVGAKGIISKDERTGVLYIRFRKLDGILKIKDGDRNLDIVKARETFDQYQLAQ